MLLRVWGLVSDILMEPRRVGVQFRDDGHAREQLRRICSSGGSIARALFGVRTIL